MKEAMLEHARIYNVVIENFGANIPRYIAHLISDQVFNVEELTLRMPNLLRVDVERSRLQVLKVAAIEKGFVKYIGAKNSCKVIEMGL